MRHARRDAGPDPEVLEQAMETYFDALTKEDKLAMCEEVDFLLTTLRWSMSLTSPQQTIMRRFTVFVESRRPDWIEVAKWELLHEWLNRQSRATTLQIWEKAGIEEGWDVTVPAGMPYWSGADEASCEHKVRLWSPHPHDMMEDEKYCEMKSFKSNLARDEQETS